MYPNTPAMKTLPRADKKSITKSVQNGRSVADSSLAALAVDYAPRFIRSQRILGAMWLFIGVLSFLDGGLGHDRFQIILGLVWSAGAAFVFYAAVRAKRSIPLNQALLR